jgi:hemerythrin-like domain-containing protein
MRKQELVYGLRQHLCAEFARSAAEVSRFCAAAVEAFVRSCFLFRDWTWHGVCSRQGMNQQVDPSTQQRRGNLRGALVTEHAELHRLFQDVLEAFRADARVEAGRLWNQFDRRLQAHMAMEEQHLLPVFEQVDAPEAAALRREHDKLRNRLLQLGIGVDLHLTNQKQIEGFVEEFEAHARREDKLLYRFAEQTLSNESARQVALGADARGAAGT